MAQGYVEISRCRVCGGADLESVLSLGRQTLTGVFPRSRDEAITAGPVELVRCVSGCGLVQLRQSYDKAQMYGPRYGYHSGLNPSMVRHLQEKVRRILELVTLRPGELVVDIGSNDATLLKAYPESGPILVGVDPTGEQFKSYYPAHARIIPEFFSSRTLARHFPGLKAKIVTSIAMFYDLDAPMDFVAQVRDVLARDGIWVLEQSYLPAMIEATAYDTICHEHLEYYALRQLLWMTKRSGLRIVDVETNAINGGSFSLALARDDSPYPEAAAAVAALLAREAPYCGREPYVAFASAVAGHRRELLRFIGDAVSRGRRIAGYGASTKGNVILQYCGLTEREVPWIGEVNPEKFGCFTPGTLIPIVPEAQVRQQRPDYLLVLPWHFKDFIVEKESAYRASGGGLLFPLPRVHVA